MGPGVLSILRYISEHHKASKDSDGCKTLVVINTQLRKHNIIMTYGTTIHVPFPTQSMICMILQVLFIMERAYEYIVSNSQFTQQETLYGTNT